MGDETETLRGKTHSKGEPMTSLVLQPGERPGLSCLEFFLPTCAGEKEKKDLESEVRRTWEERQGAPGTRQAFFSCSSKHN